MRIKNVCGDERGFGSLVIEPDETHDIEDPIAADWFLRHGCAGVEVSRKPEIQSERPNDQVELAALRERARDARIPHWWTKSAATLTEELTELDKG